MGRRIVRLEGITEKTGVPLATLRYWRATGQGPPTFKLGRHVVAFEDEVDKWVEEQAALEAKPS